MSNWVIVSKENKGYRFYPIHLIAHHLEDCVRLTYKQAANKKQQYWKDKFVIFHCVWADGKPFEWLPIYKNILKWAKVGWLEFDADHHLNNLITMEQASWGKPFFIWDEFQEATNNFIWEVPMSYSPFIKDVNRLQFKMYDKNFEQPIPQDKDIDVVGFVDTSNRNIVYTMAVLRKLHEDGYNVKCIVTSKRYYELYKKTAPFELVRNTMFTSESEQVFHKLLKRSKFLLDISDRITLGRNAYEALLIGGTLPILNSGYGCPSLHTYNQRLSIFCDNLSHWIDNYSIETIERERSWFGKEMSIKVFIEKLIGKTDALSKQLL